MSDEQSERLQESCTDDVRHLLLQMVKDDTDLTETAAMDIYALSILPIVQRVTSIQVSGWFHRGMQSKLPALLKRCAIIRLLDYQSSGPLDLHSTLALEQHLDVSGAPQMDEICISPETAKVSATDCPMLREVSSANKPSKMLEMCFTGCASLRLSNMHSFILLTNLLISNSAFHEDILTCPSLRKSLVKLTLISCTGPARLELVSFLALNSITMSDSQLWTELFVANTDALASITVKRCTAFKGVLPHIGGLPKLTKACYEDCPQVKALIVSMCPLLESLQLVRTGLCCLCIVAHTCPKVRHIRVSDNPGFWTGEFSMQGTFLDLTCLEVCGNLIAGLPNGLVGAPVLRTLDIGRNRIKDPLDLSKFKALETLCVKNNIAPPLDRGGLSFKLHIVLDPVTKSHIRMKNTGLVLLGTGASIDTARLAPVSV